MTIVTEAAVAVTSSFAVSLIAKATAIILDGHEAVPDPTAPSIYTVLQEQLGLRLEATRGLVDVYIIDHVERPAPD